MKFMEETHFTILPIDVLLDHRLTLIETRVLGAILSFRSKTTNVTWPSREGISRRCGYAIGTVSNATSSLVKKGWLKKSKKHFNGPNEYEITIPANVTDPVTLTDPVNVIEPVITNVTDPVSTFVTDPVTLRYQEETNRRDQQGILESLPSVVDEVTRPPPCPHQSIVNLYHQILPEMVHHLKWEGTKKTNLAKLWKSEPRKQTLEYWEELFKWIRDSDFLMGRTDGPTGPFECSLEWIVGPKNFAKISDLKYHRKRA